MIPVFRRELLPQLVPIAVLVEYERRVGRQDVYKDKVGRVYFHRVRKTAKRVEDPVPMRNLGVELAVDQQPGYGRNEQQPDL